MQGSFLVPIGDVGLATRGDAAVEGRDQDVLTDRGSLGTPFGQVPIEGGKQIDGLRDIPDGSGGAEFMDGDLGWFWAHQAIEDALRRAEVDGRNNLGLAIDAPAFAQVVVGFAANDLLSEAWHSVRSYYTQKLVCQGQNTTKYGK